MGRSAEQTGSGSLFIVAAPSGGGKTSLVNALLQRVPGLALSVSHTTRPKRPAETSGEHYHFVDEATFGALVKEGAFLEHAEVFGYHYGTSRARTMEQLSAGLDVILEIDWQGARQVRASVPESVGIFILPPSRAALEARLRARGQDSDEVIARRMQDAVAEMSHYHEFEYLIVNEQFDEAVEALAAVVLSHRLRQAAQAARHARRIAELLTGPG